MHTGQKLNSNSWTNADVMYEDYMNTLSWSLYRKFINRINALILMTTSSQRTDSENGFIGKQRHVKYMVSLRCKMVVKSEMEKLGFTYKISKNGALHFDDSTPQDSMESLRNNLREKGFILLNESESIVIDRIINTIVEVVHYTDSLPQLNYTELISKHEVVGKESILKIFSDVKGMSVMQFIVIQKIEKIKELILYDDLSLIEIAQQLAYKNQRFMIAQFKKVTGLSPSDFKRIKKERQRISNLHAS